MGSTPSLKLTMSQQRMKGVEEQIQEDWANREYIELITRNIKKIADFLNSFGRQKLRQDSTLGNIQT